MTRNYVQVAGYVCYCLVCQLYFFQRGGRSWSFSLLLQVVVARALMGNLQATMRLSQRWCTPNIVVGFMYGPIRPADHILMLYSPVIVKAESRLVMMRSSRTFLPRLCSSTEQPLVLAVA
jgi:hypothetical protein